MSGPDTLLVIEDSQDDRFLYRRILSDVQGLFTDIKEVATAEEALDLIKVSKPLCCLLDYQLPGMNGLAFLKELQISYPEDPVPVVVLTGQGDETLVVSVMQHGAQDYLIKGTLTSQALRRAIEHAINACKLQRQLNQMAYYDTLTGLLSRAAFLDRLQQAVARAQRAQQECALFYMDLDHFKIINDTRGHDAGDALLQTVAARIQSQLRASDVVGRLGGDEFVVLLENVDIETSDVIADKVLAALNQPVNLNGWELPLSASLGIAHYPETAMNWRELLKYADLALYDAKNRGRSKYHHFSPQQKRAWLRRRALEAALPYALEQQEIEPFYQPIFSTADQRLVGFELLSRWRHVDMVHMKAAELMDMIESLRLMDALNDFLIGHACAQLQDWSDRYPELVLSVNIAAGKWHHDNLAVQVEKHLAATGVAPGKLEIEINEAMLMRYPEQSAETLQALRKLGVRVALDNVGTGFISLRYLADLPLDTLKIDRSFWINAQADERSRKVIAASIALGRSLGLTITAQGIEGEAQWHLAKAMCCDQAQGFWLGEPKPGADYFQQLLQGA